LGLPARPIGRSALAADAPRTSFALAREREAQTAERHDAKADKQSDERPSSAFRVQEIPAIPEGEDAWVRIYVGNAGQIGRTYHDHKADRDQQTA
jgi:hypothetical protein